MLNPFLGQITLFPYSFAPRGWAFCAGQLLSIQQNSALFSLLGINFGGNGTSTFGLPDLRGRVPLGFGQLSGGNNYILGETAGVENVTIDLTTMASHSHALNASTAAGTKNTPSGFILSDPKVGGRGSTSTGAIYNPAPSDTTLVPKSVGPAGKNQPHNNVQPSLVLTPCIALVGDFPARN
jgi:microcystin-dependent protein